MRTVRKIIVWLFAIALTVFLFIWLAITFVSPSVYEKYLQSQVEQLARSSNINISLSQPRLKLIGLEVKEVDLFVSRLLMPFTLQDLSLRLNSLKMLFGTLEASFHCSLYDGNADGNFSFNPSSQTGTGIFNSQKIDLSKHPSAISLGITSGKINLNIDKIQFSKNMLESLSSTIEVSGLSKPVASVFKFSYQGNSLEVIIPRLSELTLILKSSLDGGMVTVNSFRSTSSLGEFTGQGSAVVRGDRSTKRNIDFKLSVILLPPGKEFLGPYLPLLSNNRLHSNSNKFSITVSGTINSPRVIFSDS